MHHGDAPHKLLAAGILHLLLGHGHVAVRGALVPVHRREVTVYLLATVAPPPEALDLVAAALEQAVVHVAAGLGVAAAAALIATALPDEAPPAVAPVVLRHRVRSHQPLAFLLVRGPAADAARAPTLSREAGAAVEQATLRAVGMLVEARLAPG